jgi:hypothetical protein
LQNSTPVRADTAVSSPRETKNVTRGVKFPR